MDGGQTRTLTPETRVRVLSVGNKSTLVNVRERSGFWFCVIKKWPFKQNLIKSSETSLSPRLEFIIMSVMEL